MGRLTLIIQDSLEAGVQLYYYYFGGEEVRLDGTKAKFMVAARNFSSELEREKISQRTHEHLLNKSRRGLNVGGRCRAYDNIEIRKGDQRSHVQYTINDTQAEVLRLIFQLYSDGQGLRAIAKLLNEQGNFDGQVGNEATSEPIVAAPVPVVNLDSVRQLTCGHRFTCALRTDGSIWCWGENRSGAYQHASYPQRIRSV